MKETNQATRHRARSGRQLAALAAVAALLGAVLLVVALVVPRTGHNAAAGFTAPTAAAGTLTSTPTPNAAAMATASASAVQHASASPTSPRPSVSTATTRASSGAASLAGRIQPGVTYQGVATEYSAADGNGACLFGPAANMMIAAMNYTDYENAKACGAHILVHAANGASITVLITNECPLPCAPGQLDLSQQAFVALAGANLGRMPITWSLVSPAGSGTLFLRYKTGSSQYWCGIQVIGHRNPVASLEVRVAGSWRQLPRTDYNYFLSADGAGCGGAIRITDVYGQQLVVNGITISPDVVQPTQVQFAQH